MKRKRYDKQFKLMTVKLLLEEQKDIDKVSEELKVHSNTLRRWLKEYEEHGERAFPGQGNALLCHSYEIKKLERRIEDLKMENELLKKYQAFLNQKSAQDINS